VGQARLTPANKTALVRATKASAANRFMVLLLFSSGWKQTKAGRTVRLGRCQGSKESGRRTWTGPAGLPASGSTPEESNRPERRSDDRRVNNQGAAHDAAM